MYSSDDLKWRFSDVDDVRCVRTNIFTVYRYNLSVTFRKDVGVIFEDDLS